MSDVPTESPRKLPSLAKNRISAVAAVIATIALLNIIFLVIADAISAQSSPYVGILAFMIMPGVLGFAIVLFVVGVLWERKRRRNTAPDDIPEYPDIDLNDRRTRRTVIWTVSGSILFLLVSVLGSYRAYEFTDSDRFCGQTCHSVMNPEYTAYKQSPHARVGCVNCHVGSGAGWYVKSKLSGSYQLYSVVAHKYPKPIPSPVENLRPAQETCEQCHWPEKFFGAQMKVFNHFAYDENNTPREIRMLIKTGGGSPTSGLTMGIHWHMNISNKITFVASDRQRQKVEFVRVVDRAGRVTEFKAQDTKMSDAQIAAAPQHRMDCVDCHNRPTHIYVPPDRSVDRALLAGRIDRTIPFVKAQAVAAISKDYATTEAAVAGIAKDMEDFYQAKYPQVYATKRPQVDAAVAEAQSIFKLTRFPEMKVDWRSHPDNIGHFYTLGCFRCHDNQHVSKDGKVIRKDCNICHTVLGQEEAGVPMNTPVQMEFKHPVEMGDMTQFTCTDCHTGGAMQQ